MIYEGETERARITENRREKSGEGKDNLPVLKRLLKKRTVIITSPHPPRAGQAVIALICSKRDLG